ncbi:guanitoxin biosynthesis pre-guanitoxin forming N-methyltransferase GntF [Dactylosporangium sp. AC04546]|uniref:guanitoxin biosynthesis pre-guanitoxin forming N-methyltransferase GntF n=1 Tax=Dactylosporangium sp. AC04546 TaxID=2862460 RepID=UPI001EE016C9|nr:guanitoxin biosynthesis pre-guanitoxin forming N-methyltransferase GntF [Dactylosporangium sp. AC04546]WVK89301.1 guanitoxin biosynthesis pre-guanitoxin forming N-methyltransferase GntF [Dactylosporangium sp. AC04546]
MTALTARRASGRSRRLREWLVTAAATAASVYALDVTATAAGVALVAAGWLGGIGHGWAVAFLAVTYLAWGAGLRVALRANRLLLETTGTSTNALSKAAYDLARRLTGRARPARLAAAGGYTATEIVKELPYYAGAFGVAALSDTVGGVDALVFLGGANLGAALYELGLARLVRAVVRRRRRYASFDTDWVPAEYLAGYYSTVEPDEVATIAFLVEALRRAEPGRPVLFFGVGPTLHHVFAAAGVASEIHLGDYLPANLAEIRRWIEREPGAHDWRPFVRHTLRCEGNAEPSDDDVAAREDLTRARITALIRVDARDPRPVDRCYATVVSAYCADSATGDRATWERYMRHITGLVGPGGLFVTAALRRCRGYTVGGRRFPSAYVDEHDVRTALRHGFDPHAGAVEVHPVPQVATHGYAGIVLAWARRSGPGARGRTARPAVHGVSSP